MEIKDVFFIFISPIIRLLKMNCFVKICLNFISPPVFKKKFVIVVSLFTKIFLKWPQKRHIPKKCPSLRLVQRYNIHKIGMRHAISMNTPTLKVCCITSFEVPVQRWTFIISLSKIFYSVIAVFYAPLFFWQCKKHLHFM